MIVATVATEKSMIVFGCREWGKKNNDCFEFCRKLVKVLNVFFFNFGRLHHDLMRDLMIINEIDE